MKRGLLIASILCSMVGFSQPVINAKNAVKLNLFGLPINNYGFQYERKINNRISALLGVRIMPSSRLPFSSQLTKMVQDDIQTETTIKGLRVSNFAITPEMRFYLGKRGNMRGFYVAPFYRFAQYKLKNMVVFYNDNLGSQQSITLSGAHNTHTFGVGIGKQWVIGKMVVLDWMILGPHIGTGKGSFKGVTTQVMNSTVQNNLIKELDDFELPFGEKTVSVTDRSAELGVKGLWAGLRTSLSLGIRF